MRRAAVAILPAALLAMTVGPGTATSNALADRALPTSLSLTSPSAPAPDQASSASPILVSEATTPTALHSLNDPYIGKQWALDQIHLSASEIEESSPNVVVAVLDTGIDANDQDLAGKVSAEVNFSDSPTVTDVNGHGTRIAGIVAATADNGVGIAGVAPDSRLLDVKVADDYGSCNADDVAQGIVWAVDHGAQVINISLEVRQPSPKLEQAVAYAWDHGALIVAAAGNDAGTTPVYPAGYADTIAVSATTPDNQLAPLSNHGNWVDVAAPGSNIYSTTPGNGYGYDTGTSFAAAYVSGLAALAFSIVADQNPGEPLNEVVRAAIENSCQQIEAPGVGHGLVDAARLFSILQAQPTRPGS